MTSVLNSDLKGIVDTAVIYSADGFPLIEERKVELYVSKGIDENASIILPLEGLVIGSGANAGFQLKDPAISRSHVKLIPVPNGILVTDLGSTNGTMLGRKKITEDIVPFGSTISIGKTKVEIIKRVEREPLPLSRRRKFGNLFGSSVVMRQIYSLLEHASGTDVTVLLEGETGTGKELAARALHNNSSRATKNFQVVDCSAVSPTLIEAEFFGHVKGSFTGADQNKAGAFELANGGTLFFDEIGELPLSLQPKLLRVLESREVRRVGGSEMIPLDVRFIAATNCSLKKEVEDGNFREDLYYRLNVFKVRMPSLREHRGDIPMYIEHFLRSSTSDVTSLPAEQIEKMIDMDWPGNVRELRNVIDRALVLSRINSSKSVSLSGELDVDNNETAPGGIDVNVNRPFKDLKAEIIAKFEQAYLQKILKKTKGNISASAREAGIDRKHMERLIKKHEINVK